MDYYHAIVVPCQVYEVSRSPMKRKWLFLLCALGVLLLSGCWNGRVLYSFEQPFWATIGSERLRFSLDTAALRRGYFPDVDLTPSDTDPHERLSAMLSRHAYALAIIGPLLSFESSTYADRFPGTRFVLIDVPRQGKSLPPNVVTLAFDRTTTFREAGAAAAAALKAARPAAGLNAPMAPLTVGTLSSMDSDLTPEEISAFDAGAVGADPETAPVDKVLVAPFDKPAVGAAVMQMRKQGVEVFLLGLGSLNPSALDALRTGGGSAVLADGAASGAFPQQVLLSVENDVTRGIVLALEAPRTGVKEIRGPVRLVAGKARQPALPAGMLQSEGASLTGKGKKI